MRNAYPFRVSAINLRRRRFLHLAAVAAALPAMSWLAWAQPYPTRPVRIVIGFPPGGATDIIARLVGQWLSERLGQSFVFENRRVQAAILPPRQLRAPPDGYTLLLIAASNAINVTLYDKLNFNFIRDIAPVSGIAHIADVMVVKPTFPATTVPDFIAYAKANPGKISMASGGVGTATHLFGELFKVTAGVN